MPNKHLEHPEDLILTGETWVVDAMFGQANCSLKIDGAPAIVWGTLDGKFFVGTKSVFNKKLIKIAYTQEDIDTFYSKHENVRLILSACLQYLPRVDGIYQGDFIGFGGTDTYKPNTLTYQFPEVISQDIIIAPHTEYQVPGKMCDAEASPISVTFDDTNHVKFVQPIVDRMPLQGGISLGKFPTLTDKQAAVAKVAINARIREGNYLTHNFLSGVLGDSELAAVYLLVKHLKEEVLESFVIYNAPKCYLDNELVDGEGFVLNTNLGSFKVVDRAQFSYANFTQGQFQ